MQLDCNLCKCSNGELFCTRRLCEEDDDENDEDVPPEERNCRECGAMRAFPVCGNDGKTYPSRCFAVNCRGLDSEDLTPGPCSSRVRETDICSIKGGRSTIIAHCVFKIAGCVCRESL